MLRRTGIILSATAMTYRNGYHTSFTASDSSQASEENSGILCFGAAGLDAVAVVSEFPKLDDKIRTNALYFGGGGNAANTCTAISKLGFKSGLISKVGNDLNGSAVLSELRKDGVDTRHVQISNDDSPTMFTYIIADKLTSSRTCISTPIREELSKAAVTKLHELLAGNARILHLDSRHTEAALHLLNFIFSRPASSRPLISIDVEKDRPPFLKELLPLCDIIFTNEKFAQIYFPTSDFRDTGGDLLCDLNRNHVDPSFSIEDEFCLGLQARLRLLSRLFDSSAAKVVVCTLGSNGSIILRRRMSEGYGVTDFLLRQAHSAGSNGNLVEDSIRYIDRKHDRLFTHSFYLFRRGVEDFDVIVCSASKTVAADQIRDTTGAGDSFIGGFLVALLAGANSDKIDSRDRDEISILLRCLQFGSLVAAETIKGIGARNPLPTAEAIKNQLERVK